MAEAVAMLRTIDGPRPDLLKPFRTAGTAARLHRQAANQNEWDLTCASFFNAGGKSTPILAHILSKAVQSLGLLGGVKLGLAQGTQRQAAPALAETGAKAAIELAELLLTDHPHAVSNLI